jgi:hypothetical protein
MAWERSKPFYVQMPVPVDRVQEVYDLLARPARGFAQEFCPTCGQPDNCGDCDHTPVRREPVPEPEVAQIVREVAAAGAAPRPKKRAKPRCRHTKTFGTKKVRCLKAPNHEGRHSWMDRAE